MDSDVAGFLIALGINGFIGLVALIAFMILYRYKSLGWVYTPRVSVKDLDDP
jgi:hypothetical protein